MKKSVPGIESELRIVAAQLVTAACFAGSNVLTMIYFGPDGVALFVAVFFVHGSSCD